MKTLSFALSAAVVALGARLADAQDKVDYEKQIKPILEKSCVKCHGAEKQKGKLRLDSPDAILKGGKEGAALVAGKPAESNIVKRISLPAGHDDIMPNEGDPLTKEQIALISKWVEQGANFGALLKPGETGKTEPKHEAPKEPELPKVAAADSKALAKLNELGAVALPIAGNTNLVTVNFSMAGSKVNDAALESLKPVAEQVFWLNLAGTAVTDAGLAHVAGLKNLQRLHLEKTAITDAGLAHLKGLADLRYLNLYGSKVTDAGLASLKGLAKLEKLFVWQTGVTEAGATDLNKALSKLYINRGVEKLPEPVPVAVAPKAINAKCPVKGVPVKDITTVYKGQTIGFC